MHTFKLEQYKGPPKQFALSPHRRGLLLSRPAGFASPVALMLTALTLLIICTFFYGYNRFLVDKSLGILEQSLQQVSYSQTAGDVKNVRFFLDQLLVAELSEDNLDPRRLGGLDFSQSIAAEAKSFKDLRDVKLVLEDVTKDRQDDRKAWQRFIDKILSVVQGYFGLSGKVAAPKKSFRSGRAFTEEEKAIYERARKLDEAWDLAAAINLYEELMPQLREARDLPDVQFDLAYAYIKTQRYAKASSLLERLRAKHEGFRDGEVAAALTVTVERLEALKQELQALTIKIDQTTEPVELQRLLFKAGMAYYQVYDLEKAEGMFQSAVDIRPDNQRAVKSLFYLGITYKFHNKLDEARATFKRVVEGYPKSEFAIYSRYQLADTLFKAGDFEQAAEEFHEIAQLYPDSEIATMAEFRAGYTYYHKVGDPVKAQRSFARLEKNPKKRDVYVLYSKYEVSPNVISNLRVVGYLFLEKRLFQEARNAFEQAVINTPEDAWAHSGLAIVKAIAGENEVSIHHAMTATALEPNEFTLAVLGYVHHLNADHQEAIKNYRKALLLNRDNASVLYNLATLFEQREDYEKAIVAYHQVLELLEEHDTAEVCEGLARSYWEIGKQTKALEFFKKVVALKEDSVSAHFNLGMAYHNMDLNPEALVQFKKVLAIDPEFIAANKMVDTIHKEEVLS